MRLAPIDDDENAGDASEFLRGRGGDNLAPSRSRGLSCGFFALAIIGCVLVADGGSSASAQVLVDGPQDAVHIEANDVSLQEVLAALQAKFNLRYRSDDALETRKTGIFDGPLPRVTARILEGYDFAMQVTPQGIDVLVLRQNQADDKTVAASATPAVATPKGSPAPVMTAAQANRFEREHFR